MEEVWAWSYTQTPTDWYTQRHSLLTPNAQQEWERKESNRGKERTWGVKENERGEEREWEGEESEWEGEERKTIKEREKECEVERGRLETVTSPLILWGDPVSTGLKTPPVSQLTHYMKTRHTHSLKTTHTVTHSHRPNTQPHTGLTHNLTQA